MNDIITHSIIALLVAIRAVESSNGLDQHANGNDYQITSLCVHDVNRIYGTNYRWPRDVRDRETAEDIIIMYLGYYGMVYFNEYHRLPSKEVLAKIYHCGYKGFQRGDKRGKIYWRKIKSTTRKQRKTIP